MSEWDVIDMLNAMSQEEYEKTIMKHFVQGGIRIAKEYKTEEFTSYIIRINETNHMQIVVYQNAEKMNYNLLRKNICHDLFIVINSAKKIENMKELDTIKNCICYGADLEKQLKYLLFEIPDEKYKGNIERWTSPMHVIESKENIND